jgi:hypothetical protein
MFPGRTGYAKSGGPTHWTITITKERAREAEAKAWAATSDDLRARGLDLAEVCIVLARESVPDPLAAAPIPYGGSQKTRHPLACPS